jgi:hypothetical protein
MTIVDEGTDGCQEAQERAMSCERTLQELDLRIDEQRQVECQKGG